MLITMSAFFQIFGEIPLGSNPSTQYPFFISVCSVSSGRKPIGIKPALKASIASGASRRAMASAIGLRQAFPMQTNNTFFRSSLLLIRTFSQHPKQRPFSRPCRAEASKRRTLVTARCVVRTDVSLRHRQHRSLL